MDRLIQQAVELLRAGRLVAFPTETVYGLGADARRPDAVARIFAAKGRPSTNPLIVHVAGIDVARRYAAAWPDAAQMLARAFWPGPLTLVLPKTDVIAPAVTAGLHTVGLRAPNHPLTLELLTRFDGPLAGPSANRSNRISPTTTEHVRQELGERVDLILDGGPCHVGIESTVLDLSGGMPRILRPGGVAREAIEAHIGPVDVFHGDIVTAQPAASPGQQPTHYAPHAPAFRFEASQKPSLKRWLETHLDEPAVVLAVHGRGSPISPRHRIMMMPADAAEYARRLYAAMREADALRPAVIFVEEPPAEPAWAAVRDRLHRACRQWKEEL